jgi:8-oxo-dGTP diphosphatase
MQKLLGVAGKALIVKEGEILFLQRSLESGFDPGLWELPGGKIAYGEDIIEALLREVQEEVGLKIKVGLPFKTWHFTKEPYWVTGVTFLCEYISGDVLLSEEHAAFTWIKPSQYESFPLSKAVKEQIMAFIDLLGDSDVGGLE